MHVESERKRDIWAREREGETEQNVESKDEK